MRLVTQIIILAFIGLAGCGSEEVDFSQAPVVEEETPPSSELPPPEEQLEPPPKASPELNLGVRVSWTKSGGNPEGYMLYSGATKAMSNASVVSILNESEPGWNPETPDIWVPLNEVSIQNNAQTCLAVAAFNAAGVSPLSEAHCIQI